MLVQKSYPCISRDMQVYPIYPKLSWDIPFQKTCTGISWDIPTCPAGRFSRCGPRAGPGRPGPMCCGRTAASERHVPPRAACHEAVSCDDDSPSPAHWHGGRGGSRSLASLRLALASWWWLLRRVPGAGTVTASDCCHILVTVTWTWSFPVRGPGATRRRASGVQARRRGPTGPVRVCRRRRGLRLTLPDSPPPAGPGAGGPAPPLRRRSQCLSDRAGPPAGVMWQPECGRSHWSHAGAGYRRSRYPAPAWPVTALGDCPSHWSESRGDSTRVRT